MSNLKLAEIATKIDAHLKRFEKNPKINEINKMRLHPYFHAMCVASGNRVFCQYISYQGQSSLTKSEAIAYLEKLDKGFIGRHYEALRSSK